MSQHGADDLSAKGDALVPVRVRPRASRTAIEGMRANRLLISVTAPPVEDRANEAVRRLLAKTLGIATGRVRIAAGKNSRDKLVRVEGMTLDEVTGRLS